MHQQLSEIHDTVRQAVDTENIAKLLDALRFPTMNERFRTVHGPAPRTFEWIFGGLDEIRTDEPQLNISFSEWLESGSGIFHIIGKPGSGKSTLMKSLCEHQESERLLQIWRGDKQLIFSKFFFWRMGSTEEKSLQGLVRGLLWGVIQEMPELAKSLFPKYWELKASQRLRFNRTIVLTDTETLGAFNALIHNRSLFDTHRICFFVDGLDEFDESDDETHWSLTQKISQWAGSSPENIKFCVSSRALPVFTSAFSGSPRLAVHNFTTEDIARLVKEKLEDNPRFKELAKLHPVKCTRLRDHMTERAEGVFMWVSLVLNQLEAALGHQESIAMLEAIVDRAPEKLSKLFESTLQTIPDPARNSAYCLLAIAMRASGILLDTEKRDPIYKYFDERISADPQFLTLIACSSIFELLGPNMSNNLSDILGIIPEADEDGEDGDYNKQIQDARILVGTRCRCFLECDEHVVRFTHRSVPEFLQQHLAMNAKKYLLSDQVIGEALAWTVLLNRKYDRQLPDRQYRNPDVFRGFSNLYHLICCLRQTQLNNPQTTCRLLHCIELRLIWESFNQTTLPETWRVFGQMVDLEGNFRQDNASLLAMSARFGLHEYVSWDLANQYLLKDRTWYFNNVGASAVLKTVSGADYNPSRSFQRIVLESLFHSGLSPHEFVAFPDINRPRSKHLGNTLWHSFFIGEFVPKSNTKWGVNYGDLNYGRKVPQLSWDNMEMWLRNGADARISFEVLEPGGHRVSMKDAEGCVLLNTYFPETESFQRIVERSKGHISFEDFLRFQDPTNLKELLSLAQRNRELVEQSGRLTIEEELSAVNL